MWEFTPLFFCTILYHLKIVFDSLFPSPPPPGPGGQPGPDRLHPHLPGAQVPGKPHQGGAGQGETKRNTLMSLWVHKSQFLYIKAVWKKTRFFYYAKKLSKTCHNKKSNHGLKVFLQPKLLTDHWQSNFFRPAMEYGDHSLSLQLGGMPSLEQLQGQEQTACPTNNAATWQISNEAPKRRLSPALGAKNKDVCTQGAYIPTELPLCIPPLLVG